jgi:hypothetical protein
VVRSFQPGKREGEWGWGRRQAILEQSTVAQCWPPWLASKHPAEGCSPAAWWRNPRERRQEDPRESPGPQTPRLRPHHGPLLQGTLRNSLFPASQPQSPSSHFTPEVSGPCNLQIWLLPCHSQTHTHTHTHTYAKGCPASFRSQFPELS